MVKEKVNKKELVQMAKCLRLLSRSNKRRMLRRLLKLEEHLPLLKEEIKLKVLIKEKLLKLINQRLKVFQPCN